MSNKLIVDSSGKVIVNSDGEVLIQSSGSSGETWVINSEIEFEPSSIDTNINFSSNSTQYTEFYVQYFYDWQTESYYSDIYYTNNSTGANVHVYSSTDGGWSNEVYRTVTFETSPTGDLLTWLQANAVKQ